MSGSIISLAQVNLRDSFPILTVLVARLKPSSAQDSKVWALRLPALGIKQRL